MLSRETLTSILLAIAIGEGERARDLVATTDEVDDEVRRTLEEALADGLTGSEAAGTLGDALRSVGAERHLVNECYRVAFYAGESWASLSDNPFYAFFTANKSGRPLDKWVHYFPIYQRHLSRFRGRPCHVLEIGVYRAGGLKMLSHYLGPQAYLVGVDIDEAAQTAAGPGYFVEIGDQADPQFLRGVAEKHGPFDVIVDDGGHTMRQQVTSVQTLFPLLADGGTYIVEDCHTSYWPEYADQEPGEPTFLEWTKGRVDDLHAYHFSKSQALVTPWQTDLAGLHIYDSVVVMDKEHHAPPFSEISGTHEYINYDRLAVAAEVEFVATRDRALLHAAQIEAIVQARASDLESRAAEVEARAVELEDAADDFAALAYQADRLELELLRERDELEQTRSDLHGSWGIIREMRTSKSWRLTAPLRRAKWILRGRP